MIFLIFTERWSLAEGGEDCGLVDSVKIQERRRWRDSRGEEVPLRDCAGEEGVEEDTVLCLFLVQSSCSSGRRVRVVEEAW